MTANNEKKSGRKKSSQSRTSGTQRALNITLGIIMITGVVSTALGGRMLARQKSATPNPVQTLRTTADPTSVILHWQREGGISGTCDELFVTLGGIASADNCIGDKNTPLGTQQLSEEELQKLQNWVSQYQSFTVQPSGTPVPDGYDLQLVFKGSGDRKIDTAGLQEVERLAEAVFGKFTNAPMPDSAKQSS